jgi:hypothetical protein
MVHMEGHWDAATISVPPSKQPRKMPARRSVQW